MGQTFPTVEFTVWVSSELTCLRAPFSISAAQRNRSHARTQRAWVQSCIDILLGSPQPWQTTVPKRRRRKKVFLVFLLFLYTFLSFPLSNVAERHLPCTDRIRPSCFDCSAAAPGQNTFWLAPGSPVPLVCTSPAFGGGNRQGQWERI